MSDYNLTPSLPLPDQNIQPRYQLQFINKVQDPTYTTDLVRDEIGVPIRVEIFDSYTRSRVSTDCFLSSVLAQLMVVDAEYWKNRVNWSRNEFVQTELREREGKRPILTGRSLIIQLKNGVGSFENIVLNDNSSWTKSGFRLAVMVKGEREDGYFNEERVQEGVSERFRVKDRRGKAAKKPDGLELTHSVRCIKKIGKDRASCLENININNVENFLKLYYNDEPKLRKILRIKSESSKEWEAMIDHVMLCADEYGKKCIASNNSSQPQQNCMIGPHPMEGNLFLSANAGSIEGDVSAINKQHVPISDFSLMNLPNQPISTGRMVQYIGEMHYAGGDGGDYGGGGCGIGSGIYGGGGCGIGSGIYGGGGNYGGGDGGNYGGIDSGNYGGIDIYNCCGGGIDSGTYGGGGNYGGGGGGIGNGTYGGNGIDSGTYGSGGYYGGGGGSIDNYSGGGNYGCGGGLIDGGTYSCDGNYGGGGGDIGGGNYNDGGGDSGIGGGTYSTGGNYGGGGSGSGIGGGGGNYSSSGGVNYGGYYGGGGGGGGIDGGTYGINGGGIDGGTYGSGGTYGDGGNYSGSGNYGGGDGGIDSNTYGGGGNYGASGGGGGNYGGGGSGIDGGIYGGDGNYGGSGNYGSIDGGGGSGNYGGGDGSIDGGSNGGGGNYGGCVNYGGGVGCNYSGDGYGGGYGGDNYDDNGNYGGSDNYNGNGSGNGDGGSQFDMSFIGRKMGMAAADLEGLSLEVSQTGG